MKKNRIKYIIILPFVALIIFLLINKTVIKVESNQAGLTLNKRTGTASYKILKEGVHIIGLFDDVILYDITKNVEDFELDILFKDAISGKISFSLTYTPVVDSLPKIFQSYKYDYHLRLVNSRVKDLVRNDMSEVNHNEVSEKGLSDYLSQKLTSEDFFDGLVKVDSFQLHKIGLPIWLQ